MLLLDTSYWEMRTTEKKGRGLFALNDIPAGTVIGDYLGNVMRPKDDDDLIEGLYGLTAHETYTFYPDIPSTGLHCINHSCMANCAMYPDRGHMLYICLRRILKGEELTVSYMVEPDLDSVGPTYPCYCNTPLCHGSMIISWEQSHAFWDVFVKQKMGNYYNHLDVQYGQQLPKLPSYPTAVEDELVYDMFGALGYDAFEYSEKLFPSQSEIRALIRSTGRCIYLSAYQKTIIGITNGMVVYVEKNRG